ncbi:MAG: fructosamine kinase family protein [Ignavibacteriae bacterium]|nr:fructosamine kinase family protein [Ignavibacteriota bacterium]
MWKNNLENFLQEKIISSQNIGGGCIANSQVVKFEKGKKFFVKQYSNSKINFAEANGLLEIEKSKTIRVPKVIFVNEAILVLEYIEQKSRMKNFSEIFGRQLAQMHKFSSDKFGFYEDNFCGSTPQKNLPMCENWIEFYLDNRLKFQFILAEKNGYVNSEFRKEFSAIEKNIHKILEGSENIPTLLHGDLWSGNYISDVNGNPCLIDPAIYYGNREADLAMTKLFGGFDSTFYSAYNEEFPLAENWSYRENIYKLYHILNHLNLFGMGYYSQCLELIKSYRIL